MSTFDSFADAPNQIKTEGETITLTYKPGIPVDGSATVGWNIPSAAHGCVAAEDGRGAYCGIVITVSSTPPQAAQAPVDGQYYTNDPTADADKHAGSRLNGALVVGAFYEGEKRSRGEDLTQTLVLSDIQPNTQYFVAGYAVDCQGRYHSDGVRSFSSEYGNPDAPSSPSSQIVQMNNGEGVLLTDGTNLPPGEIYAFDIEVNENFPAEAGPQDVISVSVDGTDVQTYGELIDAVNAQLLQADNPPQSPIAPNTGSYLVDASGTLQQWGGESYTTVPALFELTDPTATAVGDYWFNAEIPQLQQWDTPAAGWNVVPLIEYATDPTLPTCDDIWFNGTQGYQYNGTTWCESPTYVQVEDPTAAPGGECGLFWFDEGSSTLFEWNEATLAFIQTEAVMWDEPLTELTAKVLLPLPIDGTFWYDLTENKLYERIALNNWSEETDIVITSITPTGTDKKKYWYDPEHETLRVDTTFPGPGGTYVDVPFIAWPTDPARVVSCTLWWDSTTDELKTWDIVNSEWDVVKRFVQSEINPTLAVEVEPGSLWSQPDGSVSYWDGNAWTAVPAIIYPTDPQNIPTGTGWLNTTTGDVNIYDAITPQWNVIDPIDASTDPSLIAAGELWYDLTTNTLFVRDPTGTSWVPVPYTTASVIPNVGDQWFDTTNNVLNEWSGTGWVQINGPVVMGLTAEGNLAFQTTATGSCVATLLLVPGGNTNPNQVGTGFADFHSFSHYHSFTEASFTAPPLPNTLVTEEGFLFNKLPGQILPQVYGIDGLSGTSMYDIVGVGTDGTPDERRELADTIRAQLGYPTVEVELTPFQLDIAITGAIESLRKRSDVAYKRGFYFMDVTRGYQKYQLTNKKQGFDKIVGVMAAHRMSAAFLSAAGSGGVYGQVVLQHLYTMGTFDLTSFHLVAQYVEQMEHLFATRITFNWDETSRIIHLHQKFHRHERILLDCYVERTEQDLFKDRWCKSWIEKYALAQARLILSEIRGKYASLPGAGGGISLNASDLAARADQDIAELYQQLDDQVTGHTEVWGMGGQFVIG